MLCSPSTWACPFFTSRAQGPGAAPSWSIWCNQWRSVAISGNQWQSGTWSSPLLVDLVQSRGNHIVISDNQWQSPLVDLVQSHGNQWQSLLVDLMQSHGNQWQSVAISASPRGRPVSISDIAISGNQWQSVRPLLVGLPNMGHCHIRCNCGTPRASPS